ncbi:MAG TPA: aldehyde dehydrogenase [Erysipelothrix sp.]
MKAITDLNMYIDGEFVRSSDDGTFNVLNPANGNIISRVPAATLEDTQQAINSSAQAQKEWSKLPSITRGKYLLAIAKEIRNSSEHFAHIISEEMGKPLAQSLVEVEVTAEYFEYIAGWARKYEGEIIQSDRKKENILIFKQPIGVVAGILPWNFPFFLIARKAAPALLTGNTIILKPSSLSPNNALEFAKLLQKIELPKGVINIVTGSGKVVGEELSKNEKIGMVTLTGSTAAGQKVMKNASKNITKVSLELGGKAPAIIMDDANIDLAVEAVFKSRIINTGQVCNCTERVYVHENIASEFIDKITKKMSEASYGDPLEKITYDMGPLASEESLKNVEKLVENAVKQGATILTGGKRAKTKSGYYYEPTVLTNVDNSFEIMREEVFGPVLPISTFSTLDEAIELSNDCQYGLTSSIFTNDVNTMMQASNELQFGETYVNRENFEAIQGFHAGWKKSGIGGADGRHGLEEFLQTHAVYIQYE